MQVFGQTRSRYSGDYALITPDTHVNSPLIDWVDTTAVIHISPEMGARFSQYTAMMEAGSKSGQPGETVQRFVYVQEGSSKIVIDSNDTGESVRDPSDSIEQHDLRAGSFVFIPEGMSHMISCADSARLVVFEKEYRPHPDVSGPSHVVGHADDISGEPFMGDEDARLQTLLPIAPELDMAVNIFTYQPGATLPQVEVHVMEHGLLMLSGQGVYRLSEDYHPVGAGDVIWMASYCPQWFVAMGKTPASYIYYKDIHRDRLTEKEL